MKSRIRKWSDGLRLDIPQQIAKKVNLHAGSHVTIEIENDKIIISPHRYDLNTMLKDITSKNLHDQMLDD